MISGCPGRHQLAFIEPTDRWDLFITASSMGSYSPHPTDTISDEEQSYDPQRWHQFLIYVGLTMGAFCINGFMNSILPVIYRGACKKPIL